MSGSLSDAVRLQLLSDEDIFGRKYRDQDIFGRKDREVTRRIPRTFLTLLVRIAMHKLVHRSAAGKPKI